MCKNNIKTTGSEPLMNSTEDVAAHSFRKCNDTHEEPHRSWYGWLRIAGCIANMAMILGMYLEYLWAADYKETPEGCHPSGRYALSWLDLCDCMHRYTFSDAMLRGQNLELFGIVGTCVAVIFITVELERTSRLRSLLKARLTTECSEAAEKALSFLNIYTMSICAAFIGVLGLVPFHLERPLMHYSTTGCVVSCMLGGVCTYAFMPLQIAAGVGSTGTDEEHNFACGELKMWAKRQQLLRGRVVVPVVAMHVLLPATAAIHHFVWHDLSGRLFGAVEVLTILSYQVFVAVLANDDFHNRA